VPVRAWCTDDLKPQRQPVVLPGGREAEAGRAECRSRCAGTPDRRWPRGRAALRRRRRARAAGPPLQTPLARGPCIGAARPAPLDSSASLSAAPASIIAMKAGLTCAACSRRIWPRTMDASRRWIRICAASSAPNGAGVRAGRACARQRAASRQRHGMSPASAGWRHPRPGCGRGPRSGWPSPQARRARPTARRLPP